MRQASLKSVLTQRANGTDAASASAPSVKMQVVDLFCGAGGFSAGAAQEGCEIVLAVDACAEALATHEHNHPEAAHFVLELPCALPFPRSGPWHLHMSPPCQKFSLANNTDRRQDDSVEALGLVEWCLKTALASGAQTWTFEQVASKAILHTLEAHRRRAPNAVAYYVFDFLHLGVPQTRRRVVAGTPWLVAALMRERQTAWPACIADAIAQPRGTHIRDATYAGARRLRRALGCGG